MKRILLVVLMMALAFPAFADYEKPGKGVKVQPARATWNTGYFQAALVEEGLSELGYNVKKTKELQNPLFYLGCPGRCRLLAQRLVPEPCQPDAQGLGEES
jgi:glycine betaine/proline transport system substrate-binding protein